MCLLSKPYLTNYLKNETDPTMALNEKLLKSAHQDKGEVIGGDISFDSLPEDVQYRIFDYLQTLGVSDGLTDQILAAVQTKLHQLRTERLIKLREFIINA